MMVTIMLTLRTSTSTETSEKKYFLPKREFVIKEDNSYHDHIHFY